MGVRMARVLVVVLVAVMVATTTTSGLRRSGMVLNPVTGGVEDMVVVVSPELAATSCPQILSNIKVGQPGLTIKLN